MQLNEISKTNPDWLTSFLCPVVADNFYFQRSVFNIDRLRLDCKSIIEISHTTSDTNLNLSKKDRIQLEKVDPHHTILLYVNSLLVQFRHTSFKHFRIRIEYINHDQCTVFHTDNVKLRLVQTLWGRSTEVIESTYANYDGIGKGRNELIILNNEMIKSVPNDHFILMKGSRWSDGFKACIHKSPEIEVHQERRLLIVIDFDEQPLRNHSGICDV
jgi:hypothetical protein